jgi:hypothetical protein
MGALLSRYTFKLVDESDAAILQKEPHWQLELYSVGGDGNYSYKPNEHWVANLVVVLYDQLPQMTDEWLENNKIPWSLDPSDVEIAAERPPDTYGIPPTNSLRDATKCEYEDRACVRVVSMCRTEKTKLGHSAQGIAASSATVGAVGMSVYRNQKKFPPAGYVYVVPFELPESAIVERELTAELDCALCFESRDTKMDQGMIIGGCGHYICKACCEDEQYNMGIKKLEKCPTCRRPCALAPALKREEKPFEFKYHWKMEDLLKVNGFDAEDVKQYNKKLGLKLTREFIDAFTKKCIEQQCDFSPELSRKMLVLWEAGVKYVAEYVAAYEFISFLIGRGFDVMTANDISEELGIELDEDIEFIEEDNIDDLECIDKWEKKQLKDVIQAAKTAHIGVPGNARMDDAGVNYAPFFVDYLKKEGFSGADADAVAVKLGITDTELCVCVTESEIRELRVLTNEDDMRAERVVDWDVWERELMVFEKLAIRGLITLLQSDSNEEAVNKYWRQHNHKELGVFLRINGFDPVRSGRFAAALEMDDTKEMRYLSKGDIHKCAESSDDEDKIWRLRQMFVYMQRRWDLGLAPDFVDYLKREGFSENNAARIATDLGISDTILCVCVEFAEIDALRVDYQSQSAVELTQTDKWKIRNIIALLRSSSKVQVVNEYWIQNYDSNAVKFFVNNKVDSAESDHFADEMGLKFTDDLKLLDRQDIDEFTMNKSIAPKIWRLKRMLEYMTASAIHVQTMRKVADWAVRPPRGVGVQCLLTKLGHLVCD